MKTNATSSSKPRRTWLMAMASLCLLLPACGQPSPQQMIVGTWQSQSESFNGKVEFTPEGKVRGNMGIVKLNGTYRLVAEGQLELELGSDAPNAGNPEKKPIFKLKYELSRNDLTTTDPSGNVVRFRRVK